jgi:hypothetical protein
VVTPAAAQHHHGHTASAAPITDSALLAQIASVRKATERYRDHANASADGYRKFGTDGPLMGEHWYHPQLVKQPLDLNRPATLQYAQIDGKRVLVGVAYNVYQEPGQPLPEGFLGDQDHWHVHDMPKLARLFAEDRPFLRWMVNRRIERGKVGAGGDRTQLTMVHAWVWQDNPQGMFAQEHRVLPYLRAGLPAEWAASASNEAAWGVALLKGGCSHELDRLDRLARLEDGQKQKLRRTCESATKSITQAQPKAKTAEALNGAAERAWKSYVDVRESTLTAEQKKRLASVIEPMMGQ